MVEEGEAGVEAEAEPLPAACLCAAVAGGGEDRAQGLTVVGGHGNQVVQHTEDELLVAVESAVALPFLRNLQI